MTSQISWNSRSHKKFKEWVLDPKGYETVYLDPDRLYSDDEDVGSSNGKVKFTYKIRNEVVRLNIHVEMPGKR